MAKAEKEAVVRARVPLSMKRQVLAIAEEAGESESMVVRRAIRIYLAKHSKELAVDPEPEQDGSSKHKKKAA